MIDRKEALIGVGVAVALGAVVLLLKSHQAGQAAAASTSGGSDIAGGFQTAGTVFVPTTAYTIDTNNVKGNLTYSTVNNATTTTYSPIESAAPAPMLKTTTPATINTPTSQTNTKPVVSAPNASKPIAPKQPVWVSDLHKSGVTYATPKGGFNWNTSVVDWLKTYGFNNDQASRAKIATDMGIKNYNGTAAQNEQMLSHFLKWN